MSTHIHIGEGDYKYSRQSDKEYVIHFFNSCLILYSNYVQFKVRVSLKDKLSPVFARGPNLFEKTEAIHEIIKAWE